MTSIFKRGLTGLMMLAVLGYFMAGCSSKSGTPEPVAPTMLLITNIAPTQAKIGDVVTVKGTGFGHEVSRIKVYFGGSELVRPTTFNDTSITVVVPPDASSGRITVSILAGESTTSDQLFGLLIDDTDYINLNKIQFTGSKTLSSSRTGMAAAATGNKIIVAGGTITDGGSQDADIYDVVNNTWQNERLSEPRVELAGAGVNNKIVFAGGKNANSGVASKTVDIYNVVTGKWTTGQLSVARYGLAAVAAGSLIYFAGGRNGDTFYDVIDVYDTGTGTWSTKKLSVARAGLVASALGGKVLFAGGEGNEPVANKGRVVDIYNADITDESRAWSTGLLSTGRTTSTGLAVAGIGRKMIFGGGGDILDPHMDVYDAPDNTWRLVPISELTTGPAAAAGTKIVFSLGKGRAWVYDVISNTATSTAHSGVSVPLVAAATKSKMLFAGAVGRSYDTYTVFR